MLRSEPHQVVWNSVLSLTKGMALANHERVITHENMKVQSQSQSHGADGTNRWASKSSGVVPGLKSQSPEIIL